MLGMLITERAIFFVFNSRRLLSLILGGIVIPALTIGASKNDNISRHNLLNLPCPIQ